MNGRPRVRPVPRLRVLAGGLLLLAALTGVGGLAEWLRPPPAPEPTPPLPAPDDPRAEVVCPPPPPAGAEPVRVTSGELLSCPQSFDGHTVVYEGEAIGAVLSRADGAWVQLNDDAYAGDLGPLPGHRRFAGGNSGIGVHVPPDLADAIAWVGDHDARGDVLSVVGTYRQTDPQSGEVAVIRANAGDVIGPGGPIAHERLRNRQVVGGLLAGLALGLLAAGWLAARRR